MLFTMRIILTALILSLSFAAPFAANAQVLPAPEPLPTPQDIPDRLKIQRAPAPDGAREDDTKADDPQIENGEAADSPQIENGEGADSRIEDGQTGAETGAIDGEDVIPESLAPDYSKLSPDAERTARLEDLFEKLAEREDEESANLVAEEILAIWTESGSASVNLLLRRGTQATAKGNPKLARKMYNHAVDLSPEFAEVWARSARLALTQKDYNRALNESLKTLQLEPRHFYTLWTLGNVFEVLNRNDDALEAYREANRLYPEFKPVKDRLEELEVEVEGTVL